MKSKETNKSNVSEFFSKIVRRQVFIPIAALLLLAIFRRFIRLPLATTVQAIRYYRAI